MKEFLKVIGGADLPLPEELKSKPAESLIKKRKKSEEDKEEEKGPGEKRQKKDGPDLTHEQPFKLYSRTVQSLLAVVSTFETTEGTIVLPDEAFYKVVVHSNLVTGF